MDYKNIYEKIIEKARSENRVKEFDIYYENHHILPRCMNGSNDCENLVLLTAKEHFICHKILPEIYPNEVGLKIAAFFISYKTLEQRDYRVSASEYERLRIEYINSRDFSHTEEVKIKISNTLKLLYANKENHPQYGTHRSEETKQKLREASLGNNPSEETRLKISKKVNEAWKNEDLRKKQSEHMKELWSSGVIKGNTGKPSPKKGKPFAGDKEKLSESLKEYYRTHEHHNKIHHKVVQLDTFDNIIKVWDSEHDAAKEINGSSMYILKVCRGKNKTHNGFKWKFYEDIN